MWYDGEVELMRGGKGTGVMDLIYFVLEMRILLRWMCEKGYEYMCSLAEERIRQPRKIAVHGQRGPVTGVPFLEVET